jgi:hypothetical protein
MICPQCKKQIADNSAQCQFCSYKIDHKKQLPKEISMRRYQRWFFYGLISFLFIGMIITIVKIYNVNTNLVTTMVTFEQDLKARSSELEETKTKLITVDGKVGGLEQSLVSAKNELALKTESYKEILFEKGNLEEKYNNERNNIDNIKRDVTECEAQLDQTDAMVYAMIVSLGVGVSNDNLAKIPVADANFAGVDTDSDGLSDSLEEALGTNKEKRDSDDDGFDDRSEVLGNFNPSGDGNLPIDDNFAKGQKGKILLQVEGNGEAWYVNPDDGKRYFLGRPAEALALLANL